MSKSNSASAREFFAHGMTRFERRLYSRMIDQTLRGFSRFQADAIRSERLDAAASPAVASSRKRKNNGSDRRRPENATARHLVDFLRLEVHRLLDVLTTLTARHHEFCRSIARVVDQDEYHQIVLDYAVDLGSSWGQRIADRRALKRWLDDEAMNDRYLRRRGELELQFMFTLARLATIVHRTAKKIASPPNVVEMWERLGIEGLVRAALDYGGDRRVRVAAMQCLATSLSAITPETATRLVSRAMATKVQRLATDASADTWMQCAAIDVLAKIDNELFLRVIRQRLMSPQAGDDLFVRRHCLNRILDYSSYFATSGDLFDRLLVDPSPAVRQRLAATLWRLPFPIAWPRLMSVIEYDVSSQVRAAALNESLNAVTSEEFRTSFLELLAKRLNEEQDVFCRRVGLQVAALWLNTWYEGATSVQATAEVERLFDRHILPAINRIQSEATDVPSRRWATAAAEQIWVQLNPTARQLHADLKPIISSLSRGKTGRLPARALRGIDQVTIGRTLAVLTQNDLGVELIRDVWGHYVEKQPRYGFRFWRAWCEFCRPATDKRQAYSHTRGRVSHGRIRSPSRIMGELSATKVPGEPLVIADDGTWRPFLPLVDDFVSALNQNLILPRATRIYSNEGVTEIKVTRNPLRRMWTALRLVARVPKLAELRNWDSSTSQRPQQYLQAMQRFGFRVKFQPHPGRPADSSVTQFFPALLAIGSPSLLPFLQDLLSDYAYYFSSSFENTLIQLVVFTAAVLVLFLSRHALSNMRIWLARRQIPLSIGGWGTRGKSGTERLKAALMVATGHGLVSKTTGCEAMFIQAPACGDPLEIPLYRPGEKATIWEQSDLLRLAADMRPSVFMWECMALTPDYVDVLQQQWMHDDLATITNTYPDHEDIQGPSGMDVASTITAFVPRQSHLLTTEQQMYPLVRERCQQRRTSVRPVSWLESGLITDDLLDRFPYREHPDNIALVAAMAGELGCEYDFAVKAMADHLIPDLGVLKTHPVAQVQHCSIEFTNGMSANERFGCLGNWKRLGFDRHDFGRDDGVFISTVVNNRADRVARSRVFASVLVNDLRADRHFLIGSNLRGLQGFIWEAWSDYERTVSLRHEGGAWDVPYALEKLQQLASRFRVQRTDAQLTNSLNVMLKAVLTEIGSEAVEQLSQQAQSSASKVAQRLQAAGVDQAVIDRIQRYVDRWFECRKEFDELSSAIQQARSDQQIDRVETNIRATAKEWFRRTLIVIDDYDATGDQVIQQIVDETPPGFLNRVMGIQNIKGTGLDFVYRFHAWDRCFDACQTLDATDQDAYANAVLSLESLPNYGPLCQDRLQQTLDRIQHLSPPMSADSQIPLESIQRRLAEDVAVTRQQSQRRVREASRSKFRWVSWAVEKMEQWLEVQDAVRRRKTADTIYRDLGRERISRQRAVEELRRLNKRQKGGWFANRLAGSVD